jgi:hypothetical protein
MFRSNNTTKGFKVVPGFKNLKVAKKGVKSKELLVTPILSQMNSNPAPQVMTNTKIDESFFKDKEYKIHESDKDDPIMCIQCEYKDKNPLNKSNPNFNLLDEMFMMTYAECVANVVDKILLRKNYYSKGKT